MIVDLFLRLVLGHVVGDFALQPLWLALAKRDGWKGLILHVGVVVVVTMVLIMGTIPNWLGCSVALYGIHLLIDQFRTFVFTDNSQAKGFILLLTDQLLHLISLLGLSWAFTGESIGTLGTIFSGELSPFHRLLLGASIIVTLFWVIPIIEIELAVAITTFNQPGKKGVVPIELTDRFIGGIERTAGLGLAAFGLYVLIPVAFAPRFIQLWKQNGNPTLTIPLCKTGASLVSTILLGLLWNVGIIIEGTPRFLHFWRKPLQFGGKLV